MPDIVISDTSCLIVLQNIQKLDLLNHIFGEVIITQQVQQEFQSPLPDWIKVSSFNSTRTYKILELDLDAGEASAISLALEKDSPLLLMDEKRGRTKAQELGIQTLGTLGVLIKAKEQNQIQSLSAEIEKLISVGFWVSQKMVKNVLRKYEK